MPVNLCIGVDMAKAKFDACFDDREVVKTFENNEQGIRLFFQSIEVQIHTFGKIGEVIVTIGVESTCVYHLLLCVRATTKGYTVKLINPLITNKYSQRNIRKTKTDKIDTRIIRYCTLQGEGYSFKETAEIATLKHLVRERNFLSQMKTQLNSQMMSTSYKNVAFKHVLPSVSAQILRSIERNMKKIEVKLKSFHNKEQRLLQSIPGVGPLTAATCLSEIQTIERFKHPKQLIAFIGIDPKVHQSGSSIDKQRHISKRGNVFLRTRFYNATSVAVLYDNEFKTYFQKKISEGKPYRVALVATMNKMIRVLHAVWKRGTPYVK